MLRHDSVAETIAATQSALASILGTDSLRRVRYTGSFAWQILMCADEISGLDEIRTGKTFSRLFDLPGRNALECNDVDIQIGRAIVMRDGNAEPSAEALPLNLESQLRAASLDPFIGRDQRDPFVEIRIGNENAFVLAPVSLLAYELNFRVFHPGKSLSAWRATVSNRCRDCITLFGRDPFECAVGDVAKWQRHALGIDDGGKPRDSCYWAWNTYWELSQLYDIPELERLIAA